MKNYSLTIQGHKYEVAIEDINAEQTLAKVTVNGNPYQVEIEGLKVAPKVTKIVPQTTAQQAAPVATPKPVTPAPVGGTKVLCPLPGTVTTINVKVGDTVTAGQTLVVLEAMKMENNIDAEKGGVVKAVNVQAGSTVMEGDVLIVIE